MEIVGFQPIALRSQINSSTTQIVGFAGTSFCQQSEFASNLGDGCKIGAMALP
jgi:hypothetical protein